MEIKYKSEAGKQEVLGYYREILANWPVKNRQYEIDSILKIMRDIKDAIQYVKV
ncbi:MAG: hypothetical protein K0S75_2397 [Clostridia bacterium]|jgi:hypothetical protein|nr:hypothetical protein [Clostridia bacterium]